jgi:low temperature requirement protein LtrA
VLKTTETPSPTPALTGRATPLELFFDLVYVFAFTQVTHVMAEGESVQSILGGLAVLGILWWSWASHAWLANQRVADRGVVRVGILLAIAIVLVLSIAIPEVYPEEGGSIFASLLFAVGFVVLSVVYMVVNLATARHDRAFRGQVLRTMGITIVPVSAALIGGALAGGTTQLVLWLAAVAVYGITVFITSQGGQWQLPSTAHYAERHGLVVILALGESIISIGLAASHSPLTPTVVMASLLAVSVALGMWWVYFGRVAAGAERRIDALTGSRRIAIATIGTYVHFAIVAGVLLVSLGMGDLISRLGSREPLGSFGWMTTGVGVMLFLAATAAYSITTSRAAASSTTASSTQTIQIQEIS